MKEGPGSVLLQVDLNSSDDRGVFGHVCLDVSVKLGGCFLMQRSDLIDDRLKPANWRGAGNLDAIVGVLGEVYVDVEPGPDDFQFLEILAEALLEPTILSISCVSESLQAKKYLSNNLEIVWLSSRFVSREVTALLNRFLCCPGRPMATWLLPQPGRKATVISGPLLRILSINAVTVSTWRGSPQIRMFLTLS